jgi:hypothetical protein
MLRPSMEYVNSTQTTAVSHARGPRTGGLPPQAKRDSSCALCLQASTLSTRSVSLASLFSLLSTRSARRCDWHQEKSLLREEKMGTSATTSFLHPQIYRTPPPSCFTWNISLPLTAQQSSPYV